MEYKTIIFDVQDNIATITLNRPEVSNAINADMTRELMQVALYCKSNPVVRAVMLTGAGSAFCVGGDINGFAEAGENLPGFMREMSMYLHAGISLLLRLEAPLVVAVNGVTAGAGLGFVCAGDITLAAESARFAAAYTGVGLAPDGSTTYSLPRAVGLKRALDLVLTNRMLSAQEALDWGIVTRVVPDAELLPQACKLTAWLAAGPTKALGISKWLLRNSLNETLETQLQNEGMAIAEMAGTADAVEGVRAFLEKRKPDFQGR